MGNDKVLLETSQLHGAERCCYSNAALMSLNTPCPPPASVLTRFPTFPPRTRASPSLHLAEIGSCRPTSHFTALRLKLLSHCGGVTRPVVLPRHKAEEIDVIEHDCTA